MRGKDVIPLTAREFALLELLLLHAPEIVTRSEIVEHVWDCHFDSETNLVEVYINEIVTRSEIVEHVWDCHFDSETNLVEVYINRLRQKIDQDRSPRLLHTVRGLGYRLGDSES